MMDEYYVSWYDNEKADKLIGTEFIGELTQEELDLFVEKVRDGERNGVFIEGESLLDTWLYDGYYLMRKKKSHYTKSEQYDLDGEMGYDRYHNGQLTCLNEIAEKIRGYRNKSEATHKTQKGLHYYVYALGPDREVRGSVRVSGIELATASLAHAYRTLEKMDANSYSQRIYEYEENDSVKFGDYIFGFCDFRGIPISEKTATKSENLISSQISVIELEGNSTAFLSAPGLTGEPNIAERFIQLAWEKVNQLSSKTDESARVAAESIVNGTREEPLPKTAETERLSAHCNETTEGPSLSMMPETEIGDTDEHDDVIDYSQDWNLRASDEGKSPGRWQFWVQCMFLTNKLKDAEIRDKWNSLSDAKKKVIAGDDWNILLGKSDTDAAKKVKGVTEAAAKKLKEHGG